MAAVTSIRSIALPTEHGGWGFTLEPIILGLLAAPSPTGWELGVAAIAVLLARRPVKIVATDLVRRRWLPRSRIALLFALGYGSIAIAGLIGAFVTETGPFWWPYLVAIPFALYALRADAHSKSRTLGAEISGAVAMGSTAAAITMGAGMAWQPAFGLWLVLAARDLGGIVLARAQIRRVKGGQAGAGAVMGVHAAALAVVAAGAVLGVVPWLGVVAVGLVTAVSGVSLARPPVPARIVGWTQIGVGFTVAVLTGVGARFGW
jgi:hypothetical protein